MQTTGTGPGIEFYIQNYELTGDPYSRPGRQVIIEGAHPSAEVINAVKLLRKFSDLSVGQANATLKRTIAGNACAVQTENPSVAESLCRELHRLGFVCHQQPEFAR